ncbi:MAG TPA: hypothetical protein VIN09_09910 [Chloroflexota bacterium]
MAVTVDTALHQGREALRLLRSLDIDPTFGPEVVASWKAAVDALQHFLEDLEARRMEPPED